ncbi:hypothetical protein EDD35_1315 [Amycolatopsis thermoflava]|uniref:Uncharacterized protein n=1 Tax=Amycolatopsis thermoflava TaxID=84480 RepID=A0A3N2GQZ0_9PSEU|nr:hypothetical protein EDD35_1315 [Amycolatopsis thermoflava]
MHAATCCSRGFTAGLRPVSREGICRAYERATRSGAGGHLAARQRHDCPRRRRMGPAARNAAWQCEPAWRLRANPGPAAVRTRAGKTNPRPPPVRTRAGRRCGLAPAAGADSRRPPVRTRAGRPCGPAPRRRADSRRPPVRTRAGRPCGLAPAAGADSRRPPVRTRAGRHANPRPPPVRTRARRHADSGRQAREPSLPAWEPAPTAVRTRAADRDPAPPVTRTRTAGRANPPSLHNQPPPSAQTRAGSARSNRTCNPGRACAALSTSSVTTTAITG